MDDEKMFKMFWRYVKLNNPNLRSEFLKEFQDEEINDEEMFEMFWRYVKLNQPDVRFEFIKVVVFPIIDGEV